MGITSLSLSHTHTNTNKPTNKHIHTYTHTHTQTNKQTHTHTYTYTNKQTNIHKQTNKQTRKQTNKQACQAHVHPPCPQCQFCKCLQFFVFAWKHNFCWIIIVRAANVAKRYSKRAYNILSSSFCLKNFYL